MENGRRKVGTKTAAVATANSRKEKVVHARFSATEFNELEAAAKAAKLSVSAFLRSLSLHGAGIMPFLNDEDRAVLSLVQDELRTIGANLNGIARALSVRSEMDSERIFEVVASLRPALTAVVSELNRYVARLGHQRDGAQ
jgi:hypothetical protein